MFYWGFIGIYLWLTKVNLTCLYSPPPTPQTMTVNKISYLRFLNLMDALDRINPGKKLDCLEESLLDKIVLASYAKSPVLVGDLISLSELGSQATLHGRLKNLSAMGYIKMAANVDGRKKEVVPTKMALKRYEEISKCLEKAVKAS